MKRFTEFDTVRLLSDAHAGQGATRGMVGCVVEVHGEGVYEVEFADADGRTVAQVVAVAGELERVGSGG